MTNPQSLARARRDKDDEYYTQLKTVEQQFDSHLAFFNNKKVYCNCDSDSSAFSQYFRAKGINYTNTETDYAGADNLARLERSDVLITNPPFSLLQDYTERLLRWGGPFVIIAPVIAVSNKNVSHKFVANEWFFARAMRRQQTAFNTPDRGLVNMWVRWWTNIEEFRPANPPLKLARGDLNSYRRYENLANGIHVPSIKKIPTGHDGPMGVPLTYFDWHCAEQFSLVGMSNGEDGRLLRLEDGRRPFRRVIIAECSA